VSPSDLVCSAVDSKTVALSARGALVKPWVLRLSDARLKAFLILWEDLHAIVAL
jgi:hypothetical protein